MDNGSGAQKVERKTQRDVLKKCFRKVDGFLINARENEALDQMGHIASSTQKCKRRKLVDKMSCEICGRGACTRSFHSLKEQEEFDTKTGRYAPDTEEEIEDNKKAGG